MLPDHLYGNDPDRNTERPHDHDNKQTEPDCGWRSSGKDLERDLVGVRGVQVHHRNKLDRLQHPQESERDGDPVQLFPVLVGQDLKVALVRVKGVVDRRPLHIWHRHIDRAPILKPKK